MGQEPGSPQEAGGLWWLSQLPMEPKSPRGWAMTPHACPGPGGLRTRPREGSAFPWAGPRKPCPHGHLTLAKVSPNHMCSINCHN